MSEMTRRTLIMSTAAVTAAGALPLGAATPARADAAKAATATRSGIMRSSS